MKRYVTALVAPLILSACAFEIHQGTGVPDVQIAVSATHFAYAQNGLFKSVNRTNFEDYFSVSLDTIMGECVLRGPRRGFDPRLAYDAPANAWYVLALSDGPGLHEWCLTVLIGPDPSRALLIHRYAIPSQGPSFPDYPNLGYSDDKIILTSGIEGESLAVLNKADALSGAPPRMAYFPVDNNVVARAVRHLDGTGSYERDHAF